MAGTETKPSGRFKVTAEEVIIGGCTDSSSSVIPLFSKPSYSVYRFLLSRHSDKKEIRFEARYSELREWYNDLKKRGAINDENIGQPFPSKHIISTLKMGIPAAIPTASFSESSKDSQDVEMEGLTVAETLALKRRRELCAWLEALLGAYPMLLWTKANVAFLKAHRVEIDTPKKNRTVSIVRRHSDPAQMTDPDTQPLESSPQTPLVRNTISNSSSSSSSKKSDEMKQKIKDGKSPSKGENAKTTNDITFPSQNPTKASTAAEEEEDEHDETGDSVAPLSMTNDSPKSPRQGSTLQTGQISDQSSETTRSSESSVATTRGRERGRARNPTDKNISHSRRQVKSQPPKKSPKFDSQQHREVPRLLRPYEKTLFLAGWSTHPSEVLTLGEGVGEGTFGQVFKGKLIVDPFTLLTYDSANGSGGGGDIAFASSYLKNLRDSSSGAGSLLQSWWKAAARGISPTRDSSASERGSLGGSGGGSNSLKGSNSSHGGAGGEFGEIAIKVMRASTKRHLELIESEVKAMTSCASQHVVSYMSCFFNPRGVSAFSSSESIYIVMELCEAGSVSEILQATQKPLDEACLRAVLVSVALALSHMHSKGWVHLDIKAANILINSKGCAKLCDFGCARMVVDGSDQSEQEALRKYGEEPVIPGTPFFFSPELCKASILENEIDEKARRSSRGSSIRDSSSSHGGGGGGGGVVVSAKLADLALSSMTPKADSWALGATAIQCVRGIPPYANLHPTDAIQRILKSPSPNFPLEDKNATNLQFSDPLTQAVNGLLLVDSESRYDLNKFLSSFKSEVSELNKRQGSSQALRDLGRSAQDSVMRLRKDSGSFSE